MILVFCCVRPIWNIDIFWHVAAGNLIESIGSIPDQDTFSAFHPKQLWVPFQWGYEVMVARIDAMWGLEGLRWIHILLHAAAFGLAARMIYRRLGPASTLTFALLMVAYLDRIRARPHVFNLLGVLLLALWLERAGRAARAEKAAIEPPGLLKRMLRLDLPLILLGTFWANLHAGGSLLVPVVVGAFVVGLYLERAPDSFDVLRAFLLTLLLMVLSPSFVEGVSQAFLMWGQTRELIPEWSSSLHYLTHAEHSIHWVMGLIPFFVALLVVVHVGKRGTNTRMPELLASLALLGLSFTTARFLYLAPIVLIVWPALIEFSRSTRIKTISCVILSLVLGILFLHEHLYIQSHSPRHFVSRMTETVDGSRFPKQAGEFVQKTGLHGAAMHQSDWGGYLLYVSRGGADNLPQIHVAGDGRGNFGQDLVAHFIRSHRRMGRNKYLWEARRAFPVDMLVFPKPTFDLNYHNPWRFLVVYSGPKAEIHLMPGPQFKDNLSRISQFYGERIKDLPNPEEFPGKFERKIRKYWAGLARLDPDVAANLETFRARAETVQAQSSNPQSDRLFAVHLEWASYLEELGDLEQASAHLKLIQKSRGGETGLGAAARIRQAAIQLRMGQPSETARGLLRECTSLRLAPADLRLVRKILVTLGPKTGLAHPSH
jgi:hypothetical protein